MAKLDARTQASRAAVLMALMMFSSSRLFETRRQSHACRHRRTRLKNGGFGGVKRAGIKLTKKLYKEKRRCQ